MTLRVCFAHDHVFWRASDGEVFSEGKLPYAAWSRYLAFADELVVIGRMRDITGTPPPSHVKSSGSRVTFLGFGTPSGFAGRLHLSTRQVKKQIEAVVRASDGLVARLPSRIGHLAVGAARKTGTPWAAEVVGDPRESYRNHGSLWGKLYAPVAAAQMKMDLSGSTHAIYVTRETLQKKYPSPGVLGESSNVDVPPPMLGILRKRIERIEKGPVRTLGLIGTLYPVKGIDTAILTLKELPETFVLRILGTGDAGPWQDLARRSGCEGRIRFDGTLPRGAVSDWLDDIDIYLQPSRSEGLPRALIEAMARGCPAVASRVGGIVELLPSDRLFEPGKPRQLAAAIASLAKDKGNLVRDAERNFAVALTYGSDVLEGKRRAFWHAFAQFAKEKMERPSTGGL